VRLVIPGGRFHLEPSSLAVRTCSTRRVDCGVELADIDAPGREGLAEGVELGLLQEVGEAGKLVALSPGSAAADSDTEVPQFRVQVLPVVGHDVVGDGGEGMAGHALRISERVEVVGQVTVG